MRISRPRFTVRRLMVVVAIVPMALGAEAYRRRLASDTARYYSAAATHRLAAAILDRAEANRKLQDTLSDAAHFDAELDAAIIAKHRRLLDYHLSLAEKWDYAAGHPWLHVEHDPPKPE